MTLSSLVAKKRVVIVLGSGGVGKTTLSLCLALLAAREGKKVALLSIDPAKRLAAAMGIPLGSQLAEVRLPAAFAKGRLFAAMLDQKAVFDEMVARFVPTDKGRRLIYQNRLYQQVAANLGGPLEYVAVAKLEELITDEAYDCVVLDTPPDTHALDFLRRPNILQGFSDSKVMTWLIKPFHLARRLGMHHVLSMGEKLMGGIAKVTGVDALKTLAEFLVLMEDVIVGFTKAGTHLKAILASPDTAFVMVAAPKRPSVRAAQTILNELADASYKLQALVVNMSLPPDLQVAVAEAPAAKSSPLFAHMRAALSARAVEEKSAVKDLTNALRQCCPGAVMAMVPEVSGVILTTKEACRLAEMVDASPLRAP